MSTFTAESAIETRGYDIPTDVAAVVDATKHLCDFRSGFADLIVHLAVEATQHLPTAGHALIEPALRILGTERALRLTGRLYRIASDATGDWYEGMPDRAEAERTLRHVAEEAAHAVADEFHKDSRACLAITKGRLR